MAGDLLMVENVVEVSDDDNVSDNEDSDGNTNPVPIIMVTRSALEFTNAIRGLPWL